MPIQLATLNGNGTEGSVDYRKPAPKVVQKTNNFIKIEPDTEWIEIVKQRPPIEKKVTYKKYRFYTFYHPYVSTMIKQLNRYGIDGLLDPKTDTENGTDLLRQQASSSNFSFATTYKPVSEIVEGTYPEEGFDFNVDGPYGTYNWELFFHGPLTIASRLSQNQKFEEAQKWFHYIFNPTETQGVAPARYWKVKPFFEHIENNTIDTVLDKMRSGDKEFNKQLTQWMKNPFNPHTIARLRTTAYMKSVVMKYVDNLISWGDNLFRSDTIESINEATQLYILAAQILGPKPVAVSKPDVQPRTVEDVLNNADSFSNVLVKIESEIGEVETDDEDDIGEGLNSLNSILYFCTSPNDKLIGYWDVVADRLFKIRNCMNIDGVIRSLSLFEPPIDPALLVKASAAGIDIGTVLSGLSGAILPNYRFRYLVQKALDFCSDVKSLGSSLLVALEKKDAESLSLLRAGQEIELLKSVRQIRLQAINEAKENVNSLELAKELVEKRQQYYSSRQYMNVHEEKQLKKLDAAMALQLSSQLTNLLASTLFLLPKVTAGVSGFGGSPHVTVDGVDGKNIGGALSSGAEVLRALSAIEAHGATKAGIKGGYDRRKDDWEFQADIATKEIEQIQKQITAAEIRLAIAENELENHDLQINQSKEVEEFMQSKYTNRDLYNWMITQISGMYFQSYQLAYDVAKMAELSFRHELALEDTSFVQFGHWDSLKKGLLSGEKLQRDIRRMEVAYMEQNKREFELTKHIPLSLISPEQLIELRRNGACEIQLPEVLFDLDHPGQYMRRIKSISITIPGVTGPYTNINSKLTLLTSRIRKTNTTQGSYAYTGLNDTRFRHDVGGVQSIATSSGQNDAGIFELNFQDERYLPFEGAGAISTWRLELPSDFKQFDYDTIADAIIHMNYTAREGGELFKTAANDNISAGLNLFADELASSDTGMQRAFSLKTHFPNALYSLLQPTSGQTYQEATITIKKEHFPHFLSGRSLSLTGTLTIMLQLKDGSTVVATKLDAKLTDGNSVDVPTPGPLVIDSAVSPLPFLALSPTGGNPIDEWVLQFNDNTATPDLASKLNSNQVEDIYLIMNYTIS